MSGSNRASAIGQRWLSAGCLFNFPQLQLGIRVALHPMADLATEPRWARINGTFGEDAERSGRMIAAYIRGFQGPTIGPESVACMVKHVPGGGPQKDGDDPHFAFGRVAPQGTLPFELPSSMEAVRKQRSDVPYDSEHPLFPFGYGLGY